MEKTALSQKSKNKIPPNSEHMKRYLKTSHIVFLIIACAAPLASMLGNVSVGVLLGNGPGLPIAYIIAGAILMCFTIGFSALTVEVKGEGGFYTYINTILGKKVGMASAFVALFSYSSLTSAVGAAAGYFTDITVSPYGIHLGWQLWTLIYFILVSLLGRKSADIGARGVIIIVMVEFIILTILDATIGIHKTTNALPTEIFAHQYMFSAGLGIAVMIGFTSFIGFETAVLYSEEAVDPDKTIPRSLILGVSSIAIFYFLTSWFIVGGAGVDKIMSMAHKMEGELVVNIIKQYCGDTFGTLTSFMFCSSIVAGYLSLHNATTRYFYIISKDGGVPSYFSHLSGESKTPVRASTLTSIIVAAFIMVPVLKGDNSFMEIYPSTTALATLGIVVLQAIVAISVFVYFRKKGDKRLFRTFITPLISVVGLCISDYLIVSNYSILTGSTSMLVNSTPLLLVVLFIFGCYHGRKRKKNTNRLEVSYEG
ncbi:amino acid permease [Vibrio sp. CAIM 722]|uniref:Amino acid permease n=1 Tax=Vibrio eleionomae TaxID=2653505 RepID=A0A7X4LJG3_9VIBR|nr:APC family permease [Vibrio eleionomae]MZI93073.1 amino acid permease [Vibrio eleionomae]